MHLAVSFPCVEGYEMADCPDCGKRQQGGLPVVVGVAGMCPHCHDRNHKGIKRTGEHTWECRDPQCGFRWSDCVGCGQ